ncbi:hypothetical protein, partial [Photorhabdus sp. S8-52]|uniref:hypothetical protein n=1 Tax=Photorhabdus sp. S8-52 TaxID=2029682 RepID=UPI001960B6CF
MSLRCLNRISVLAILRGFLCLQFLRAAQCVAFFFITVERSGMNFDKLSPESQEQARLALITILSQMVPDG